MTTTDIIKSNTLAEVSISYKTKIKTSDMPKVTSSQDAYNYFMSIWNDSSIQYREEGMMLLLNRNNKVLGWSSLGMGGINSAIIDQRIIFQIALCSNASAVIIAHNHPSGGIVPSDQDKNLTKRIKECGKLLEIELLDHLIVTPDNYYSFSDDSNL